jgi:ABC-type nitrate/sulfonate/bicarbonate transport system substrate-binding protein
MQYPIHATPSRTPRFRHLAMWLTFACSISFAGTASAQAKPKFKLAYAKCAHCMSMALVPALANNVDIEGINFNAGSDALTALVSKGVDIAQITYLSFVSGLDKGFDLVAVSGHVNGGSEMLVGKDTKLAADDWAALKKLIAEYKAQGKPFRIAASRGNAQDLHMRGEMALNGINASKDVQFVNIPNPSDHAAALQRGEIELICSVEPFASQIRLSGVGKHFSYPYKQAAGRLTNLIVTRSDVIKEHPAEVRETVAAVVRLVGNLQTDKQAWVGSIVKGTGLDKSVATEALKNAYPDFKMYRPAAQSIGTMMKELKYISTDVTGQIDTHMDYSFLVDATKKSKSELGY